MNNQTGEIRRFAPGEPIPEGWTRISEDQAQIAEEIQAMPPCLDPLRIDAMRQLDQRQRDENRAVIDSLRAYRRAARR